MHHRIALRRLLAYGARSAFRPLGVGGRAIHVPGANSGKLVANEPSGDCGRHDGKKSLRIAQVAPLWTRVPPVDYGGTELRVHWLTEELVKRGHDVTLFASGDSQTNARLRAVYPCNMIDAMERQEAVHYAHYTNTAFAEALKDSALFDIIHCHSEIAHMPFSALSRAPVVYSLRTALSPDDWWVLQQYPDVTFVAMSRAQVRDLPGDGRSALPVIYNGCDFDAYDLSVSQGEYLAFLGRMGPHKNPLGAICIAEAVGWPLVLAGKPQDRTEAAYFEQKVRPLINGTTVKYIGPVNQRQKQSFLSGAAALLFPIQWDEPFGNVMIEAMACGTPVIACNRGSVAEVIDLGITGFYADSVEEMALLVPKALALNRRAVREHAEQRFSHERMVDGYERLYRLLLEEAS